MQAQNASPWKRIAQSKITFAQQSIAKEINDNLLFQLDEPSLKNSLKPLLNSAVALEIEIEIPNKIGEIEKFKVREFSNFEPALQAQFPDIRSYTGVGLTDKNASIYFSMSPKGIQTMVFRSDNATEFIEPISGNQSVSFK